jgi:hypothetical protein
VTQTGEEHLVAADQLGEALRGVHIGLSEREEFVQEGRRRVALREVGGNPVQG